MEPKPCHYPTLPTLRHLAIVAGVLMVPLGAEVAAALSPPLGARWAPDRGAAPELVANKTEPDLGGFADIVDAVKPAVIGVSATSTATPQNRDEPGRPPGRSGRGRRAPDGMPGRGPTRQGESVTSQGSGFFISADGYAVTNHHVVRDSDAVQIRTDDDKTYTAKVVGRDPVSDLALLKVDGGDFPHVAFADEPPRVGEWVLAIGNAFGLGSSVTAGIVSARERDVGTLYEGLIQIDASVNQGESGGPTFDLDGKVIGVNTMIVAPGGGSVGIAFALPADTVKAAIPQLKEKGSVTRGWIGVQIEPVTPEIADQLGLDSVNGALVTAPQANGPAAQAGIAPGDVITSVNGAAIKDGHDLARTIGGMAPGTTVELGLRRQREAKSVTLRLGELPVERAR